MARFSRRLVWSTGLGFLLLCLIAFTVLVKAQTPLPFTPSFSQVVIFATNSVRIGQGADVLSGDIVVNNAQSGNPTLEPGFEFDLEPNATTPNTGALVIADRLRVKQNAVISGTAAFNTSSVNGTIANSVSPFSGFPVFAPADLPPFQTGLGGGETLAYPGTSLLRFHRGTTVISS